MGAVGIIIYLAIVVLEIAAMWKVFAKAGQPGWGAIIPIYNIYLLCKVGGKPGWWTILFLIPIVNIVLAILVWHGVSTNFGHGAGFTVGLILLGLIFVPVLGFGSSAYRGPGGGGRRVAYGY